MNVVETICSLAAGHTTASGLLHTARLSAFGVESYGQESIVAQFRRSPIHLSDAMRIVDGHGHVAVFDGDVALFADVTDANIARLWRLGPGDPATGEPGVSVAFDPDLAQARGDVMFAPTDHPALAAEAQGTVIAAGRTIIESIAAYRARAFCIRSFGTVLSCAGLFAVYRQTGDGAQTAGFVLAAALCEAGNVKIVHDTAGEAAIAQRPWTPRI
jgi:hypothetical protein